MISCGSCARNSGGPLIEIEKQEASVHSAVQITARQLLLRLSPAYLPRRGKQMH